MPIHLHIANGCFQDTRAESDTCNTENMALKAENISYLALYRKHLLTPGQDSLSQPPLQLGGPMC